MLIVHHVYENPFLSSLLASAYTRAVLHFLPEISLKTNRFMSKMHFLKNSEEMETNSLPGWGCQKTFVVEIKAFLHPVHSVYI